MRVVDAFKDIQRTRKLLDPSSHRLSSGTEEQRAEARREWHRHHYIRKVVASDRTEIPRSELAFQRFGIVEHLPTGDYYRVAGGDPEFLPNAKWYYATESGDVVLLERPSSGSQSRQELEQREAERAARRNAPRPKPAWMAPAK